MTKDLRALRNQKEKHLQPDGTYKRPGQRGYVPPMMELEFESLNEMPQEDLKKDGLWNKFTKRTKRTKND